jgi:uncharacterized protein YjbI with pentapeptide repeats
MAADPTDLSAIQNALNDAAGKASALWTTFITFQLYLVIAFGSITHRDLLLETPIKLPLLVLIFHFYTILQLIGLASKAATYNALLSGQVPNSSDRQYFRQLLDPFPVLQFIAGPKEQRVTGIALSLKLITWLTLVAAPAAIILFAQVTFLPFHLQWVEWLHRAILLIDVAIAWMFWHRIRQMQIAFTTKNSLSQFLRTASAAICALALFVFSTFVTTYPGEWIDERISSIAAIPTSLNPKWSDKSDWTSLHTILFLGSADEVTGKPRSLLSNRLILTNQSFVDSDGLGSRENSRQFRGRDLRGAIFIGTDLRKVDFTGATLIDADFSHAKLQQVQFNCASVGYKEPHSFGEDKELCSDLRGAKFDYAELTGASFHGAKLQGAEFLFARLYGATFSLADARGVSFYSAELEGAQLDGDFSGASFFDANLTGADLQLGIFSAARFDGSRLMGASIGNSSRFDTTHLSKVSAYKFYAADDHYEFQSIYFDSFDLDKMLWVFGHGYSDFEKYRSALSSQIHADDNIKTAVLDRLGALDPKGPPSGMAWIADRSRLVEEKIKLAALSRDDYTRKITDGIYFAICFDDSPQYVVRGMLRSGIIQRVGADVTGLVKKLTDDKEKQEEDADDSPQYAASRMPRIIQTVTADITGLVKKLTDNKEKQQRKDDDSPNVVIIQIPDGCTGDNILPDQLISQIADLAKSH